MIKSYTIVVSFLFSLSLFANTSAENCGLDHISIMEEHLLCMKNNILTHSYVEEIKSYNKNRSSCPNCEEPFLNAYKLLNLYKRDFLSLGVSKNNFGGHNLYGLFKDNPYIYKLWFYKIDEKKYQLRGVSQEAKREDVSKSLIDLKLLSGYWISI